MADAARIGLAGFTLIRSRPRAVLAWGFVYLLFGIVTSLVTRPLMAEMIRAMPAAGAAAPAPAIPPGLWPALLAVNLGSSGMLLVLLAAAMRAVLKPEEQGAYFIRVGMDELRLLGTTILLLLIGLGAYLAMILVVAIVIVGGAAIFAGTVGTSAADGGAAAIFVVLAALLSVSLLMASMIALQTRFALALPLTLVRGRVVVLEGWRRSRGHFWPLLGGFAIAGMIVSAVSLLLFLPMLIVLLGSGGGVVGLADPSRQIAIMHSPWLYPMWLLAPLLGGFFIAMTGGSLGQALLETEAAG
ncbi:hypothetical protein [Sphingomonas profundi]|uniref:hypothetical protein n=1 Tax=Alterirhizorhabdus profundi TaxID=2681549 RepID=UPI0012E8C2EF|nr:hypothetical protein [Sphingomonas profundi]